MKDVRMVDPPFIENVMRALMPNKFKVLNISLYGGTTDAAEHLESYQ